MVTSKLSQSSSGKQHPFSCLFCSWRKAKKTNANLLSSERLRLYRRFKFEELRSATNDFQSIIGTADNCTVYNGYIDDDHEDPAAIKRFKSEPLPQVEFLTDIKSVSNLPHHPNIISLIGYCFDGPDCMSIICKYMSGGTLWYRLRDMEDPWPPLPWKGRIQICIGVARGLECLQTGNPLIIHWDIKSTNNLLNQN